MSDVRILLNILYDHIKCLEAAIKEVEIARRTLNNNYSDLGSTWKDKKYEELGIVVKECTDILMRTQKKFLQAQQSLAMMMKALQNYEETNIDGGSESGCTGLGNGGAFDSANIMQNSGTYGNGDQTDEPNPYSGWVKCTANGNFEVEEKLALGGTGSCVLIMFTVNDAYEWYTCIAEQISDGVIYYNNETGEPIPDVFIEHIPWERAWFRDYTAPNQNIRTLTLSR